MLRPVPSLEILRTARCSPRINLWLAKIVCLLVVKLKICGMATTDGYIAQYLDTKQCDRSAPCIRLDPWYARPQRLMAPVTDSIQAGGMGQVAAGKI